jgi:SAM-dependent methyltransferase
MFYNNKQGFIGRTLKNLDIDTPSTSINRAIKIKNNLFLRNLYIEWYKSIVEIFAKTNGPILELGSGGGFLKEVLPKIITSDILNLPNVMLHLDGRILPFKSNSLAGIVMVDVFHHLPDVRMFLTEAARCIKPGGHIVMNEPWCTKWSWLIYKYLHYEPFLPKSKIWHFPVGGPLSQANSALPWIVFHRDRNIFERDFPQLRIKALRLHTPFSYLLSGGLVMDRLVPGLFFKFCRRMECLLTPIISYTAMFAFIVLERTPEP